MCELCWKSMLTCRGEYLTQLLERLPKTAERCVLGAMDSRLSNSVARTSGPILYAFYNHREFSKSLIALYKRGGNFQRAAERVQAAIGRLELGGDPFQGLSVTNHGENRIPHCVK